MPDTRLRGGWLVLARVGWVTVAALIVAYFLANLPTYFVQLRVVCLHSRCAPWQLNAVGAQAIQRIGLTPDGYALLSLIFSVACVLVWLAVAAIIVWRQSRQWLGLLVSMLLIVQCIIQLNANPVTPLEYGDPAWHPATMSVNMLGLLLYLIAFALFPNGRFVPGWMRWPVGILPLAFAAYATAYISLNPSVVTDPPLIFLNPMAWALIVCMFVIVISGQIYRYRRVSTPVERQQTKWVVLGVIEGPLVGTLYFLLPIFFPALSQQDSLYFLLGKPIYNILWLFAPACFGIAILRFHLWDIDLLIRRTLIYGTLTALLAGLYLGLVIGLGGLVRATFDLSEQEPAILVVSTLVVVALIQPVRRGIQTIIDRRFYRSKYDAARTAAAFGAMLRSETDLSALSERLVTAVQETMQPAHVSLWLRPLPARPDREVGS
jgi:hypothetical protein